MTEAQDIQQKRRERLEEAITQYGTVDKATLEDALDGTEPCPQWLTVTEDSEGSRFLSLYESTEAALKGFAGEMEDETIWAPHRLVDLDTGDAHSIGFRVECFIPETSAPAWMRGIFWAGEGYEVQRDDEMPLYEGDMEAALVVAQNGYPWLVYVEPANERWEVHAFADQSKALAYEQEMIDEVDTGSTVFLFDGREGSPPVKEGGVGFTPPVRSQ